MELSEEYVEEIKKAMPLMPDDYRALFSGLGIDKKVIEDIVNVPATTELVARILSANGAEHAKRVAFWMVQKVEEAADVAEASENPVSVSDDKLVKLSQLVSDNKLSSTAAKEVLGEMLKTNEDPEAIAAEKNLIQESDESALDEIVQKVLSEQPAAVNDVKNGEMKAIGFLIGQVMKASQGKANPQVVQNIIKTRLGL